MTEGAGNRPEGAIVRASGEVALPETVSGAQFSSVAALLSRVIGAATHETLDAAVKTCLEHVGRYTEVDVAFAGLVDDQGRVSDDWGWTRSGRTYEGLGVGATTADVFASSLALLRTGRTVAVDDLDTIALSPAERAFCTRLGMRAIMLAPVLVGTKLLGVCGVVCFRPHHWDRLGMAQVELLAQLLVQAVGRHRDRGALAVASARARRIAELVPDGLALIGLDGVVRWASRSLSRMTDLTIDEMVGRPATDLLHPEDRASFAEALEVRSTEIARRSVRLRLGGHEWRWAEVTWRTQSEPDTEIPDEIVLSVRDMHEGYLRYQEMSELAQKDPLTGAMNRSGLDRCLDRLARRGATVLFLFCDLDGFKSINDTRGHDAGDRMLVLVARALEAAVRSADVVARVGGDEFAIVVTEPGDPAAIGERIRAGVREASDEALSISTGIAGPGRADDTALRRLADTAMYRAKRLGKDCWVHLEPGGEMRSDRLAR